MASKARPLSVLEVKDYHLSYQSALGQVHVLDGIDICIARGEVLGLVGESGSGKSSLAYAIMRGMPGRVAQESGEITFGNTSLMSLTGPQLQDIRGNRIAIVFQNAATALNPTQTLGEHVIEVLQRHKQLTRTDARQRAIELFQMVGLSDPEAMLERFAHQISGGEKQRVVLAGAFSCEPDLILFDEPTSALDATTAAALLDLFRDLQASSGVAALFISHDLGVIESISHRMAVIYGGRIVETNTASNLFGEPRHPYTRSLLSNLPTPATAHPKTLTVLKGPGPDRLGQPPNCVFSKRCPFVGEECDVSRISLGPVGMQETFAAATVAAVACARWEKTINLPLPSIDNSMVIDALAREPDVLSAEKINVSFRRKGFLPGLFNHSGSSVFAVNNVSLRLRRGETLGLVGESGCGKSSLARALVGLNEFTGHVVADGVETDGRAGIRSEYRRKIQIIFQNPDNSLNPRHRVSRLLERPLKLYQPELGNKARLSTIDGLLQRVQLPTNYRIRYVHELSGGEKQRIAIARAIAAQPAIIICDEITSGLDVSVQSAIVKLLREIQEQTRVGLLFITHDLNVLRHLAHHVAVMYLGEGIERRPVTTLTNPPYHPYTEALLSSVPAVDPKLHARRVRLIGSPPTRTRITTGCVFAGRCSRYIDERCDTTRPPVREFSAGTSIRCHLSLEELNAIPPIWTSTDA